jgi:uncharacterized membrane protein YqjE
MNVPPSVRRVTRDIADLIELQMQLLSVDLQSAKRQMTQAAACVTLGGMLAGSALTVTLVGCGYLLHESTELSVGQSLVAVGLVVAVIAACLALVALRAARTAAVSMGESKSELAENLRWLKATLIDPENSPRNQFRDESFPRHREPPMSGSERAAGHPSCQTTPSHGSPENASPVDPQSSTPLQRR